MIRGYFDPDSPFGRAATIPAMIKIAGLVEDWKVVHFLVDTGSSTSSIHSRDAEYSLELTLSDIYPRDEWAEPEQNVGIGGQAVYFPFPATYACVQDNGHWIEVEGEVRLAQPTASNRVLPSLLGWDILERFSVTMDWRNGFVGLEASQD